MRHSCGLASLLVAAACMDGGPPQPSEAGLPVHPAVMEAHLATAAQSGTQTAELAAFRVARPRILAGSLPAPPAPRLIPALRPAQPVIQDVQSPPVVRPPLATPRRTATTDSAATVAIETEPNSVRVVAVPVPAPMQARGATFQFERQSALTIFGRMDGTVTAADAARPIALGISVPADAPAGPFAVGVMHFACASGCPAVDVPVVLNVAAHDTLRLDPARTLAGASAGTRVRTDVAITNLGNAPTNIHVTVQAPRDWTARVLAPQPIRLAAGASATVTAQVTISRNAGMGDYAVEFRATTDGGASARTATAVRVDAAPRGVVGSQPVLVANAAVAQDGEGHTLPAFSGDLTGEVWPDVHAAGHLSFFNRRAVQSSLAPTALQRLGTTTMNSYLRLNGQGWRAGVGNVGLASPGLWATSLWGTGGTFSAADSEWKASAIGVNAPWGGTYLLGRASHRFGGVWGGAVVSDLHDDQGGGRSARTVAADLVVPWTHGAFELQAGARNTNQESGPAFRATVEHRASNWSVSALASHIPGGAAAFAGAQEAMNVSGYRKLSGRVALSGGYWRNSDPGAPGRASLRSEGWSVSPQVNLGALGSLAISGTGSRWTTEGALGAFGNASQDLRATWVGALGPFQSQLGAAGGTLERSGALASGVTYRTSAPQMTLFGSASADSRVGTWQLDASSSFTGEGVGVPSRQVSFSGGVEQVPLAGRRITGRAKVMTYHLSGADITSLTQVLGLEFRIGDSYSIGIDAERTDERRDASGRPLWVFATRLRRTIGLDALQSRELQGVVYADLNNSGGRDPGEPGVASVVVDIDGHPVTTNRDGRFAYDPARAASPRVDPRSLAPGWMAAPQSASDSRATGVLAVVPTTPVDIVLHVPDGALFDSSAVHLDRAIVVLTDSTGRRWSGVPDGEGLLRLDALPPGVYTVSADLTDVGVRLLLPQTLPTVRVVGGRTPLSVTLNLRSRPIRTFMPGGGGVTTIHIGGRGHR